MSGGQYPHSHGSVFAGVIGLACQLADKTYLQGGPNGMRIIKAGILDDVNVINNTKPGAELFAPERVKVGWPHPCLQVNDLTHLSGSQRWRVPARSTRCHRLE